MLLLEFLKSMLQLVLAPTKGWEDISLADGRTGRPASRAYYVYMAVVALSWLVQLLYDSELGLVRVIELVIVTYATFFASFYIGTFILSVAMQSLVGSGEVDEHRVRTLVAYGLSLLGLIRLIANLLPAQTPVLWFMPLYVVVILWKGFRYAGVRRESVGLFVILDVLAIIVPPMIVGWLFKILLF